MNSSISISTLRLLLCSGFLLAQSPSDDTLLVTFFQAGDSLTARINMECPTAGVQALFFAFCHSTSDLLLEQAVEGADLLTVHGGKPPIPSASGRRM